LGRVATCDQFISSETKRLWIEKIFRADCVEMEGAAVAQICTLYEVPFVIIRSLSDLANEDAEVDFQSFVIYAAKNSSMLVKEMLRLLGAQ
ncbi:MAG: 5'-methylthioadenosine/S-adenosylhomocysteine nucleosidase, partial [candidate division WOR-3 bacterium]